MYDLYTTTKKNLLRNEWKMDLVSRWKKIRFARSYHYLGIELDCYLQMNNHLTYVISKVRPMVYTLGKLIKVLY